MHREKGMKKSNWFVIVLFVISLVSAGLASPSHYYFHNPVDNIQSIILSDLTHHDPIVINRASDFIDQGFPGNGSESNPYLIEDLNITEGQNGIFVSDTRVHFVIRGCHIAGYDSVEFDNVTNGRVEKCVLVQGWGVRLTSSPNCVVSQCNISSVTDGMRITSSANLTISGNSISSFSQFGIVASSIPNSIIDDNSVSTTGQQNHEAILISSSRNLTFRGNKIFDNPAIGVELSNSGDSYFLENIFDSNVGYGLVIKSSEECNLTSNQFIHDGVYIESTSPLLCTFINNTMNGLPIGYFESVSDTIIDASPYGQVILSKGDNVTVSNGRFENGSIGVLLERSDDCRITNCTVTSNKNDGFYLYSSSNCAIYNNTLRQCLDIGIKIESSLSISIDNNTITGPTGCGIKLDAQYANITNNQVSDATFEGGVYWTGLDGLFVNNTFTHCGLVNSISYLPSPYYNEISNNTVNGKELGYFFNTNSTVIENDQYGQVILVKCNNITVRGGNYSQASLGVSISYSNNCSLLDSQLSFNSLGGVLVASSGRTRIENNILGPDSLYGMLELHTWGSVITNNDFSFNVDGIYSNLISNHTFVGNTITNCSDVGFEFYFGTTHTGTPSFNNWTQNNISFNAGFAGLHGSFDDMTVINTGIIENNTVAFNEGYGMYFHFANNLIIKGNAFVYNRWGPFHISGENCTIFRNEFYWQGPVDNGDNNAWDDAVSVGNYWFTIYIGVVNIQGSAGSVDHYPQPIAFVYPLDDLTFEEGTTGHVLEWNAYALHPVSYEIYDNDTLLYSSLWDGTNITYIADSLGSGVHVLSLYVHIMYDFPSFLFPIVPPVDQVIITVTSTSTTTTPTSITTPTPTSPTEITTPTSGTSQTTIPQQPPSMNPLVLLIGGIGLALAIVVILWLKKR